MYCEEVSQCEQSLSQCSISKEYESADESTNQCVFQESPSLCHQINFACKLNLMPACLQYLSDHNESTNACTSVDDKVEKMPSRNNTDFQEQATNDIAGFGGNNSVLKNVLENSCSHNNSDYSQELEMHNYRLCGHRAKKFEYEGKSVKYGCTDALVNTSVTAGSEFAEKIFKDDIIDGFDRHVEDVKITLDIILEKCSKVCVMDYGNPHTSINLDEEQSASGKYILDLKTQNVTEATERTLHTECLRGVSFHTKPSTINEANISHMEMIREPCADCQMPVAMPFHDNYLQDIRRFHENLTALVMHSYEKSTHKTDIFSEDSPEPTDSNMQYVQACKTLPESDNRVSLSPQRPTLYNGSCDEGENLENDNFIQNKKIYFGDIQLTKLDLISGNAQFDQGEMQVPEQSPLSSENLTDCPGSSALIKVEPTVHMPTPLEEELVAQRKDMYMRENDLMQAYSNFNNLQNNIESCAQNVEENLSGDVSCSMSSVQFEMVHSYGTDENECPSRNKTVITPHIFRDLSPLQNQSKGNIHLDMPTVETQTRNGSWIYSVEERFCCSLPGPKEHVSSVIEMESTCLPGDYVTQGNSACSAFSLLVNNTGTKDPICEENEYLCTQQFTASVSQASIAEYPRDTTEHYGLDPIDHMHVPEEEGLSAADPGCDHAVPHDLHLPTDESDVVLYDESTLSIKEHESVQVPGSASPCFKWKYAPSVCLDDILPGPKNSKPYEEETLPRIFPLRTCRRPIRVGLSKRFRTKSLHENVLQS
ncbi:uncharacterized protein [Haliotis asinina]|uniref:uncharacterized protein n=1 Tax=Haliotis asinina TaxID=109174 RepID=UPI0035325EAE